MCGQLPREEAAQFHAAAVDLIARRPAHRDAGPDGPLGLLGLLDLLDLLDLLQGDGGLGAEGEVPPQSGLFESLGVLGPVFLDAEATVDQTVSEHAGPCLS
ncbi:hypothetical protein [Streptomyces sp. NPDC057460]|uniref:hypothetical protein n=1 Tax=Streptomyces sp. NPDC057460 TaxID=3346141 RepID=UPI003693FD82